MTVVTAGFVYPGASPKPPQKSGDGRLPARAPFGVVLSDDGLGIPQNVGCLLKRPAEFQHFRCEGMAESV
jgi:hypothetical protein